MTKRGYFVLAQGENYQRMAYALALSLKLSQKKINNLSIGVTKEEKPNIEKKYLEIFDEVIEIPWKDHAEKSKWKLENEWKCIYMTPYDETIKLDADMLFLNNIDEWWEYLSQTDGLFCTNVKTYRGEIITSDYYRKVFSINKLPNIYTAFFYFKKNDKNFELFKWAEVIFNNWERFFYEFLDAEDRPKFVSTDVVFALAAKIINYQNNISNNIDIPTFVHMKSRLQNWPLDNFMSEDWTQMVNSYFSKNCQLNIGSYHQTLPFHYHVKSFLTDEKILKLEKRLGL